VVRDTSLRPSGAGNRVPVGWASPAWLLLGLLSLAGLAALLTFARRDSMVFCPVWLGLILASGLGLVWHGDRGRSAVAGSDRAGEETGQLLANQRTFLQDAAHQLKTPITIALGHAELLAAELAGHREQQDVYVMVGELTRLKSLSERLLLIAASQDPEFLCLAPVALDSFLVEALRRWQPTARRVWATGRLDAVTVPADHERLGLALDALLENAVQHTGAGDTIRLSVRQDDDARSARLVVDDSGEGIMPAEIDHIFERFRTGPARGGPRGTGLGLTLVRAVALGHGGEVQVRSTPGAGSSFELVLPMTARPRHTLRIRTGGRAAGQQDMAGNDGTGTGPGLPGSAAGSPESPTGGGPDSPTGGGPDSPTGDGPEGTAHTGRPLRRGRWPRPAVTAVAAVCAAAIAAAITIDTTSHRNTPVTEPAAPAFTLPSLRDPAQMVSLSAYRGHPVIVNFFASWCGPCERETPILASFYRTSAGRAVIIGVDADDNATAARHFVAHERVAYPVGFETTPAVTNAYGVSAVGIPETFFLNWRHRIVKRILGDVTMRELTQESAVLDGPQVNPAGTDGYQNRG
jgi:signal transduction histidine kinase/thiol-disulfide isomerase/thioredoxin